MMHVIKVGMCAFGAASFYKQASIYACNQACRKVHVA